MNKTCLKLAMTREIKSDALPFACRTHRASATWPHQLSLSSKSVARPSGEIKKFWRSPSVALSNTKTGQTRSSLSEISQQTASILTTYERLRIDGLVSIAISDMRDLKAFCSSAFGIRLDFKRLKAILIRSVTSRCVIVADPPSPIAPNACCHRIGRKSRFRA
jgi:hypothetical protein